MYRGYFITVLREIPFSIIQFPLYEYIKRKLILYKNKNEKNIEIYNINLSFFQASICGAIAGAIAATLTTPLDVIKTRVMTLHSENNSKSSLIISTIKSIYAKNKSYLDFFVGLKWRVIYISVGGICFFGTNEFVKNKLGYVH